MNRIEKRSMSMTSASKVVAPLTLALLVALAGCSRQDGQQADVVIKGGRVFDGQAIQDQVMDVVLRGDKVLEVAQGAAGRYRSKTVIDAAGLIVAPGFIDLHTHADAFFESDDAEQRLVKPWLFQGVTTIATGVDGGGTPDIDGLAQRVESAGVGLNLVPYVGFGKVRTAVLGTDARAPNPAELGEMRSLVAGAMCKGARGISTGLFYAPQSFATTEEVIEVVREAASRGGIYDTHQRDESSYSVGLLGSVEEVLRIGRETGIPIHFGHIKALGVDVHGKSKEVIAVIEDAQREGLKITADQYPWNASGTGLSASLVPRWAVDGGHEKFIERIDTPDLLAKIVVEMEENLRRRGGPKSLLMRSPGNPWNGNTLEEEAARRGMDPVRTALAILREGPRTGVVSFNMDEADIRAFMLRPWVATSSDGSQGHPRMYATYPRKYRKYVVEENVISLGEFIESSTSRAANILGLQDRGSLKAGYMADVVVFDPEAYKPVADFFHPEKLSEGVQHLVINGKQVIANGKTSGKAPGRVLLRNITCQ